MGWFSRLGGRQGDTRPGRSDGPKMDIDRKAVEQHLRSFVESRLGVEAYVEPATSVTPTTIVLIAWDGEWTRRAVPSPRDGVEISHKLGGPVYDVNQTGYPNRLREWSKRRRLGAAWPSDAPAPRRGDAAYGLVGSLAGRGQRKESGPGPGSLTG
jgi:hypothetical protein